MSGKHIVLITGANTGIGLATVKSLYESTKLYHIIAAGRNAEKIKKAVADITAAPSPAGSDIEAMVIDITSDASIEAAAKQVEATHGRVDTLINNAGASFDLQFTSRTMGEREAWNKTMDVNVSSVQIMNVEFAPLLLKSTDARLLVLTSGAACLEEEQKRTSPFESRVNKAEPGWPKAIRQQSQAQAYRASKVALNMLFLQWVRLLENDNVKLFCISPGFLATNLGGAGPETLKNMGAGDPSVGGNFIREVVEGRQDDRRGRAIREHTDQAW